MVVKFLRLYNNLSINVAFGAVFSQIMVFKLKNQPVLLPQLFILFSTVILIYTVDHLQDVSRIQSLAITQRHVFHLKNKTVLFCFSGILFSILVFTSFFYLPHLVWKAGLILCVFVVTYLTAVKLVGANNYFWFQKEIFVAIIYTGGIWYTVLIQSGFAKSDLFLTLNFFFIALQNLILFSYVELEEDVLQNQQSIVRNIGKQNAKKIFVICIFSIVLLSVFCCFLFFSMLLLRVVLIELLMSFVLGLLFFMQKTFSANQRYRWIGDGVFLFPIFILL